MSATLDIVSAAKVVPETPRWAWDGRIPLGALTIVAGPPGQGKTQLMIAMCAAATCGRLTGDLSQQVDVLYVSAEDSLEHTLTPRAIAARCDVQRLHFLRGKTETSHGGSDSFPGIAIPKDLPLLDEWLARTGAKIVVLDPVVAMIPTSLNTHRDQDVRRALSPLAHIAAVRGIAVCLVMHLNKNLEADALNRLSGSIGFGGAARSVLLFTSDPDDPEGEAGDQRILAHVKCNVGAKQPSLAYRIEPKTLQTHNGPVQTSIAKRIGNAQASANDLLSNPTSSSEATARTEAREFLQLELEDGPVPTLELKARAEDAGINWRTIERAKQQLRIKAKKTGTAWQWELAEIPNNPPVGLVGLVGLEGGKTDKTDNSATGKSVAEINPDLSVRDGETEAEWNARIEAEFERSSR